MKDTDKKKRNATRLQRGFSLLEFLVAVAILTTVIAVVTDGMIQIQKNSASDVGKVGVAQETRQFMDQILRDLRQSGYPSLAIFDPTSLASSTSNCAVVACCTLDSNVACTGPTSFSSSAIQFEGDVDGSGVSEIYIQAVVPPSGNCPCTVQRGTVSKASYLAGGTPAYYTELDNVMSQNIFTAYEFDGTVYIPITESLSSIKNIGVTLYVRSPVPDATTSSTTYPTTTMVSEARINN
jgi:prepilin-type N-terminal cleavage/methylation domain-containing protein